MERLMHDSDQPEVAKASTGRSTSHSGKESEMSDSKLHLMSFAPVPDTKTTVHVVGLPDSLRDALFTLMPPRKEGGYLNTKVLKDDLRCWLDRAVELNPVRPNVHTDSWLIALAPIDLAKLCNVIAVWISSRKDIDAQSPAYRKVMGMLHPETFEEAVRGEEICLFSGDGVPRAGSPSPHSPRKSPTPSPTSPSNSPTAWSRTSAESHAETETSTS